MSTKSSRISPAKTQAMWLTAHPRSVGVEPIHYHHKNYKAYLNALHRQYDPIKASLDKDSAREARAVARALVKQKTLEGVAEGLLSNISTHTAESNEGSSNSRGPQPEPEVNAQPTVSEPQPAKPQCITPKDVYNCHRKLRHLDFLSALRHLVRLGDPNMHAYECPVCLGLHVGHLPGHSKERTLSDRLAANASQLKAVAAKREQLKQQESVLLQMRAELLTRA